MKTLGHAIVKYVDPDVRGRTEEGEEVWIAPPGATSAVGIQLKVELGVEGPSTDDVPPCLRLDSSWVDADGQRWRSTDLVPAYELFDVASRREVWAQACWPMSRIVSQYSPPFDRVETRKLVTDMLMVADTGEFRPLFVMREKEEWSDDRERFEILVFRLHEHNFHARLDLVEIMRSREEPQPYRQSSIHLFIRPLTSPTTNTVMDRHNQPTYVDEVDLSDLSPLSAELRLRDFIWRDHWIQVAGDGGNLYWKKQQLQGHVFRRVEGE